MQLNNPRKQILMILFLAFLLRFVGVWYGLPSLYNSDEPFNVSNALAFGARKTLEPVYWVYPGLYFYFLFSVYGLYFVSGKLVGLFENVVDFAAEYFLNPTGLFLIGRMTSVLFGVAAVALVFAIGRRFFNPKAGWLAALLLALSYTHADLSHWILPEPALTFMSALALFLIFKYLDYPSFKNLIVAGLLSGLAISIKYNAGFVVVPLIVAIFLSSSESFFNKSKRVLIGLGGVVTGFLLGSPYWLLKFNSYWQTLRYTFTHMKSGMVGHMSSIPLIWPLWHLVFNEWTVGFILVAGFIYLFWQRSAKSLLLLVFILPTLLIVGLWQRTGLHYLMPIYPAMGLAGALFLQDILEQIPKFFIQLCILLILFIPPLVKIVYQDARLTQKDTRALAEEWIEKHIPTGSTIGYENYVYGPNLFDPNRFFKSTQESKLLPVELKERLLHEGLIRPSYRLVNLRKDFKLSAKQDSTLQKLLRNPYFRQLMEMRLPNLRDIRRASVQYLMISSDNYARYFTSKPPKKGTPLWFNYQNGRKFYAEVLTSKDLILLKEFRPDFWRPGPVIRVYQFKESEKIHADAQSENGH